MKRKGLIITMLVIIAIGLLIFINPNQLFTKAFLRLTGDYSTPEYQTISSILSKVHYENLNYDRLYRLENYKALNDFREKKILNIPFVQIYDRNKKMLTLASGNDCKWILMDFFSKRDSSKLKLGDTVMYEFVMERLEPIDIKTNQDTFNYYILTGWANFVPKLSDSLFYQTNEMKKTLDKDVCFSYINLDFQEDWEAEMDSLQGLSKK